MFLEQIFHLHNFLINLRSLIIENVNDGKKIDSDPKTHVDIVSVPNQRTSAVFLNPTENRKAFIQFISKEDLK